MKLEQQVCSLELAKKLKELGVKQDSLFHWKTNFGMVVFNYSDLLLSEGNYCSAFTVAELGEMLLKEVYIPYKGNSGKKRKYPQHLHCFFGGGDYFLINYTGGNSQEHLTQKGDNEANARAKMLIYLLENGLKL